MAIRERKVKNKRNSQGILTGRSGIVYDVNVKVYENGRQKSIAKRGFATRREAELYEAQIKLELQTGSAAMVGYGPESKQKLKEYLPKWYESYHHNLAKSTRYSYWSGISIHLIPMLGEVPLNKLTPQMIDDMIAQLREKGLPEKLVCHRDITIDQEQQTVMAGGEKITLTEMEYQILLLLISNPKKVFSVKEIYETVWKEAFFPNSGHRSH